MYELIVFFAFAAQLAKQQGGKISEWMNWTWRLLSWTLNWGIDLKSEKGGKKEKEVKEAAPTK